MNTERDTRLHPIIDEAIATVDTNPENCLYLAASIEEKFDGDPQSEAWRHCLLGMAFAVSDQEKAEKHLDIAFDYAKNELDTLLYATCACYLGSVYQSTGRFKEASLISHEAVPLCQYFEHYVLTAQAFKNLGATYYSFKLYDQSLKYYHATLDLYKEHHPQIAYRVIGNIGIIHQELRQFDKAKVAYEDALARSKESNDLFGQIIYNINLASLYIQINNFEDAIVTASKVIEHIEGTEFAHLYTPTYIISGEAHTGLGNYDQGLDFYTKGLELLKKYPNQNLECEILYNIGINYLSQEWLDLALFHFQESLKHSEALDDKLLQYQAHEKMATVYEKQGQLEQAYTHFKTFHQLKEEVFNERNNERINNVIIAYEVQQVQREKDLIEEKNQQLEQLNTKLEQTNVDLEQANRDLERMTVTDALTKVYNRRYLETQLSNEFELARRDQLELATIMCDIDHFKQINDDFSHAIGDEVLRLFAHVVKANVRDYDIVARYGGEEFAVVLPNTGREAAVKVAEKIRQAVERFSWSRIAPKLKVTLSLGVASGTDFESYEKLLDAADQKLYVAKHGGRNQVAA